MKTEGTMMMDTGWPIIDWINDVWPYGPEATVEGMVTLLLLVALAAWWGVWERSFN